MMRTTNGLYLPTEADLKKALVLRSAAAVMELYFRRRLNDPLRQGCYFTALNPQGDLVLQVPLGSVPREKEHKYALFSREKPTRTFEHEGHISSWQSQEVDEARGIFHYGGSVRFLVTTPWLGWSVGISGYPEPVDEAIALGAGVIVGATTNDFLTHVVTISNNPVWDGQTYEYALNTRDLK